MGDPAERDVTRLAQHLGWQVIIQILMCYH